MTVKMTLMVFLTTIQCFDVVTDQSL